MNFRSPWHNAYHFGLVNQRLQVQILVSPHDIKQMFYSTSARSVLTVYWLAAPRAQRNLLSQFTLCQKGKQKIQFHQKSYRPRSPLVFTKAEMQSGLFTLIFGRSGFDSRVVEYLLMKIFTIFVIFIYTIPNIFLPYLTLDPLLSQYMDPNLSNNMFNIEIKSSIKVRTQRIAQLRLKKSVVVQSAPSVARC